MSITVNFTVKRYKVAASKNYIDVQCEAAASDSSDPCIFVIQNLPKNALGESTERFSHVADPVDMQDFPAEKDTQLPYFRTDSIILRVRSQFQVQHIISVMRKQVSALVQALSAVPSSEEIFSQTFAG